jgi:hypothetical protein
LQDAHKHEKPLPVADDQISYPEVKITEDFLHDHEELLLFSIYSLVQAAISTPGAIDADLIAALEALIQTQRTLQSGLVYETRAENTIAMAVQRTFTSTLADYEKARQQRQELSAFRDSDKLAILVFLHRLGQQNQNGRPRGRMFLDVLREMTPDLGVEERAPSIIL